MTVEWKPLMTVPGVARAGEGGAFTLLLDPYGLYILRAEDAEAAAEDTLRRLLGKPGSVFVAYEDILEMPLHTSPPTLTVVSTKGDIPLQFPPGAGSEARALRDEALKRRPAR